MMFIAELSKYYVPGTDLSVDEQLVAFRGRCSCFCWGSCCYQNFDSL